MTKKITSLVWISKNIPDSLIEIIKEYKNAHKEQKLNLKFLISSNATTRVPGVVLIDKEKLLKKILKKSKGEIPEDVLEFALFSKGYLSRIKTIDTGTHRNAALLATVGEKILFSDDDVLCKFKKIENNNRKLVINYSAESVKNSHFENKSILELALNYPENPNLVGILESHEKLLNSKAPDGYSELLATNTGVHGESTSDTPIHLLQKVYTQKDEEVYRASKKNRLSLSYTENYVLTKKPHFVSIFSGLNNEKLLPPFFPIGRNQDGIFASTIMACLPHALIGQIPWVVKHEPTPPRQYDDDEIHHWRFRIHSLVKALLDEYTLKNPIKDFTKKQNRYEEVGRYLESFAEISNDDFTNVTHNFLKKNTDALTLKLGKHLVLGGDYSQEWKKDVKLFLRNIQENKLSKNFGIPEELIDGERSTEENIELTKELIGTYGKLLRHWPEVAGLF